MSCLNPRKTSRDLLQHVSRPDSPSNVRNMSDCFSSCETLTSIPQFDTSKVEDMSRAFASAHSLVTLPLLDTSSVIAFERAFEYCTSLTSVPALNTRSMKNASCMFLSCSSLTAVPLLNTENLDDCSAMFQHCNNVESGALALYTQMANQVVVPPYHGLCFENCGDDTVTGAQELAQIPSDWK